MQMGCCQKGSSQKVIHGYWKIRGIAQISRLLLAYTGADWEDHKYTAPEQWFGKDKAGLGMNFPNLPYIIDGDQTVTETSAVFRYIPKRFGKPELLGKDFKDQTALDTMLGVFEEIRLTFFPLFFDEEWEKKSPAAIQKLEPKL